MVSRGDKERSEIGEHLTGFRVFVEFKLSESEEKHIESLDDEGTFTGEGFDKFGRVEKREFLMLMMVLLIEAAMDEKEQGISILNSAYTIRLICVLSYLSRETNQSWGHVKLLACMTRVMCTSTEWVKFDSVCCVGYI